MKWVTRDHVHLDRVASPWLIRRFVDRDAEFLFVPFGVESTLPKDAIPFGLPGVELGAHDEEGSTFRKILLKYELKSSALGMLADVIESGIAYALCQMGIGHAEKPTRRWDEGVGLDAISRGMMFVAASDTDNIERSLIVYDALFAFCEATLLEAGRPDIQSLAYPGRWDTIRRELHGSGNRLASTAAQ